MLRRSAAIIAGLLLVPALGAAATVLAASQRTPVTSTVPVVTTAEPTTAATTTVPLAVDLRRACGPDGMMLVQAEAAGVITPLQQAALDALRRVCARAGLPLPGPPRASGG